MNLDRKLLQFPSRIAIGTAGLVLQINELMLAGSLLFGHSSMGRMMGHGLNYATGFTDTQLSEVGAQTE